MRDAWGRSLAAAVLEEEAGPPPQTLGPFDQGGHQPAVKRTRFFWGGPGDGGTSSDEGRRPVMGGGAGVAGAMGPGNGLTSQQLRSRIVGLLDEEPQHRRAFQSAGAFSGSGVFGFGPGQVQPSSNMVMMHSVYGAPAAAAPQQQPQFLQQRQAPSAGPPFRGALGAQRGASMSLNVHPVGVPSAAPAPGGKTNGPPRKRRIGGAPSGGGAKVKRRRGGRGVGEEGEFPDETETEAEDDVELHDDDDDDSDFVVGGNQLKQAAGGGRGGREWSAAGGTTGRSKQQLQPAGN